MRTLPLPPRRLRLAGLTIAGLLFAGVAGGQAADPFVAGGRSVRIVSTGPDQAALALERGRALAVALGLPDGRRQSQRLDDRFDHRTYDEVTTFDGNGRETSISRFDLDGTVAMAAALGWRAPSGRALGGEAVATRAADLARAAGLAVIGRPSIQASAGAGGWSVLWARIVDGVPVRGDGVRILVWADGTFHGLTRTERTLAARPASTLAEGSARATAGALAIRQFGSSASDLRVSSVALAWVAPNDTFRTIGLDAPAQTLRLAWVVRLEAQGNLVDRVRSVEIWVDAGDGTILGGDLVE
jgi:hypothetical protein